MIEKCPRNKSEIVANHHDNPVTSDQARMNKRTTEKLKLSRKDLVRILSILSGNSWWILIGDTYMSTAMTIGAIRVDVVCKGRTPRNDGNRKLSKAATRHNRTAWLAM